MLEGVQIRVTRVICSTRRAPPRRGGAADVTVPTPCVPGKMIRLGNNFHALAAKLEQSIPPARLMRLLSRDVTP